MRVQGKHFTHEWECSVKAVLDYFGLDDVTIIGASLGGMLAPRAAAFEKRISRVIAWSVFPNFQDVILSSADPEQGRLYKVAKWLISHKFKFVVNTVFGRKAKKDELIRWGLEHGRYAYEAEVTSRLFTDKEDACNHCNCGNVKLTFDTFMDWILQMKWGFR